DARADHRKEAPQATAEGITDAEFPAAHGLEGAVNNRRLADHLEKKSQDHDAPSLPEEALLKWLTPARYKKEKQEQGQGSDQPEKDELSEMPHEQGEGLRKHPADPKSLAGHGQAAHACIGHGIPPNTTRRPDVADDDDNSPSNPFNKQASVQSAP